MKTIRMIAAVVALVAISPGLLSTPDVAAQNAPLQVLASTAVKTILDQIRSQCEKAVKRPLMITYGTSATMKQSIDAGDKFDVAITASALMDTLTQEGKVTSASRVDMARTSVGIGVRTGSPKLDISTPEALKKALLQAKAISVTSGGASVPFIEKMAEQLGISAQFKAKSIAEASTTAAAARVVDGSADMFINLVSEILPLPGIQLVGPIPNQFDRYLTFSVGTSAKAPNLDADAALTKFLTSPAMASTLKKNGMEPVKK